MVNLPARILAAAALVLGLPLAARLSRVGDAARCALDGASIAPEYRVRLVEHDGGEREFCNVTCATNWLAHSPGYAELFVTDELSRQEVPAHHAYLVRSSVVTHRATGNRIHCFKDQAAALRHAREARGRVLKDHEKPWAAATDEAFARAE